MQRHPKPHGQAAALSFPGVRLLISLCARDHAYAEAHRKAGHRETALKHQQRAARLNRAAMLADARVADMACEVR